jgi:hypothetical protein
MAWKHRLSEVDPEKKTAVCSTCGPVGVYISVRANRAGRVEARCRVVKGAYPQSRTKEQNALNKYGMTAEDFRKLKKLQRNRCRICKKKFGGKVMMHIDHDHKTGKVRGLLCRHCNIGLGMFFDRPELLRVAADYLV